MNMAFIFFNCDYYIYLTFIFDALLCVTAPDRAETFTRGTLVPLYEKYLFSLTYLTIKCEKDKIKIDWDLFSHGK